MAFKKRQTEKKSPHIYICTPAYDGKVECNYSQAMAEAAFCAPLYGIRITAGVMGNGAFIDLARNIFVKKFLEDLGGKQKYVVTWELKRKAVRVTKG